MQDSNLRPGYIKKQSPVFSSVLILTIPLLLFFSTIARADLAEELTKCAAEQDSAKRLSCYDRLAGREKPVDAAPSTETAEKGRQPQDRYVSMMEKLWDLDPESRKNSPPIKAHHPSYILLGAYNNTPNQGTMLDVDPQAKAQNTEVKFQISGKARVIPDKLLGEHIDLWLGYTQISFWQLYNSAFSAPFRDTNYEPEGIITYRTNYDLFGLGWLNGRVINLGFNHQSNGRARPLSRSWNRVYAEFGFEKVFNRTKHEDGRNEFNLFVKPWYRLPESSQDDDNPDIDGYMGYGELQGVYYLKKHRFSVMLRNNLRSNHNRGALQLDWSFPLPFRWLESNRISGYIQYFNGYGESLLDYNASSNRIGIGFMLPNWSW